MRLETMQAELAKIDKKRQRLVTKIQSARDKQIRELPEKTGFKSIDELIIALTKYASSHLKLRSKGFVISELSDSKPPENHSTKSVSFDKRRRFSEELKRQIKKEMQAGKKSLKEIGKEFGVSIHSLRLWKREWGMTNASKKEKKI